MSRPVLLALVLLTVAVTTMLVAGNNICRLATYTKELRLHGRVQYVQAGECIVRTNYHIQPKFLNYDEGVEEADFYLNSFNITHRECCCRVGVYVLKNVRIGSTRIKYKDIESCVCQAC
ncbi:PREDICTED: uncharacterized protein LOC109463995 [Branchiostoma belcheri]|uniref:Uncharacterized protein LOC109463995 n=1 Tax=Branchiostoma belcheri TaxID=7741 RepID=A0A6P4XWM2_BRABE|nr:PREDICTED: uncharacterized protein LOC109463995 [Branchiostoma belcheri]